jgi:hypothetical protein
MVAAQRQQLAGAMRRSVSFRRQTARVFDRQITSLSNRYQSQVDVADLAPADAAAALAQLQRGARSATSVQLLHKGRRCRSSAAAAAAAGKRRQQSIGAADAPRPGNADEPPAAALPAKLGGQVVGCLEHVLAAGAVRSLHLGARLPGPRLAARLAAALAANHSLRELSLAGSGAGDDGVQVRYALR